MTRLLLMLAAAMLLTACDDGGGKKTEPEDGRPSGVFSSVEVGPAAYSVDAGGFLAEATVTIRDRGYRPVPGVRVTLDLSDGYATTDATGLVTDDAGRAVFPLRDHHLEVMEVTAVASPATADDTWDPVTVQTPGLLSCLAAVTLTPVGDSLYEPGRGVFRFQVALTGLAGSLAGGRLTWQPADDGVTVAPGTWVTDAGGLGEITVTARLPGETPLAFLLDGIVEPLITTVTLRGPVIGGTIKRGMAFPSEYPRTVGVFALQEVDGALRILGEFASIPHGYYGSQEFMEYELELPFEPPAQYVIPTGDGLRAGRFAAALYYDADQDGRWDPDEYIAAVHERPGALFYHAPDTEPAPPVAGWHFVEALGADPAPLPWDEVARDHDMRVTTAPVIAPVVRGTVAGDPGTPLRVAFAAVDGPLYVSVLEAGGDPYALPFEPASSRKLMDHGIYDGGYEGTLWWPDEQFDAATLEAWSLTLELAPGVVVTWVPVLAFTYLDLDADGRLSAADALSGVLQEPVGTRWTFAWVVDLPRELGLASPRAIYHHAGFNRWSSTAGAPGALTEVDGFLDWDLPIPLITRE